MPYSLISAQQYMAVSGQQYNTAGSFCTKYGTAAAFFKAQLMMRLLAIPPGDMCSCAAMLLVVGPGLNCVSGGFVGVEVEAAILLVIGPGLPGE